MAIKMDAMRLLAVYERRQVRTRVQLQYRRDEFERWSVHEATKNIHDADFNPGDIGCEWTMQAFLLGAWVMI